jgi:hypothetical protein
LFGRSDAAGELFCVLVGTAHCGSTTTTLTTTTRLAGNKLCFFRPECFRGALVVRGIERRLERRPTELYFTMPLAIPGEPEFVHLRSTPEIKDLQRRIKQLETIIIRQGNGGVLLNADYVKNKRGKYVNKAHSEACRHTRYQRAMKQARQELGLGFVPPRAGSAFYNRIRHLMADPTFV